MIFKTRDEAGNQIKDDHDLVVDTLRRIRTLDAKLLVLHSDTGQTICPKQPVRAEDETILLDIQTVTGSSRSERWLVSKLADWLKAGFFVRSDGEAFARWTLTLLEESMQARAITRKAFELAQRLEVAGDVSGANSVLDLLAISRAVPREVLDDIRASVYSPDGSSDSRQPTPK